MNSWPAHYRFIFFMAVVGAILGGCAPVQQRIVEVCPGAQSAQQALSLLKSNWENAASIKANGTAHICYYDDGLHKENFLVKLWANPPAEIYLQGDVAFDAKGITLGSNQDEFWLAIKPKELSSYWWGQWSKQASFNGLVVSPKLMLEALGIMEITADENWSLSKEDGFDVLSKRNNRDTIVKRIYVDNCDYLVRKIEYFDAARLLAVVELDKYKEVAFGFFVPAIIKIVAYAADNEDSINMTLSLSSIKSTDFTGKQRGRLFTRPSPQGFEHIYKIVDDEVIEQTR